MKRRGLDVAVVVFVGACALASGALAGCKSCSDKSSGSSSSSSSSSKPTSAETTAAPLPDGVLPKECELYLAQLDCNMRRTGAAATADSTIATMRAEYMKTLATPGAATELAAACKQSSTSMMLALRTSGCATPAASTANATASAAPSASASASASAKAPNRPKSTTVSPRQGTCPAGFLPDNAGGCAKTCHEDSDCGSDEKCHNLDGTQICG